MENNQTDILDSNFEEQKQTRRRMQLPVWIKIFAWIFMIIGAFVPICFVVAGLFKYPFETALYGLETASPLSPVGMLLAFLFLLKGIAGFGLWNEKDWAIIVSQADAVLGIVICIAVMVVLPFVDDKPGFDLKIRFELILLIPYLMKINKIKAAWNAAAAEYTAFNS